MLSDEEIISLNRMKLFVRSSDLSVVSAKDMDIVVTLVEKQSKEIEELNSDLEVFKRALTDIEIVYNKNYTSNDKIKAKIEDILNSENSEAIEKLIEWQSLLEKE